MSDSSTPFPADSPDPSPQIRQKLTGDRNQVIGQAIDSTIMNFAGEGQVINLTVYDRIPQELSQPTISSAKPLTQQEYRQRKVLLNKVKEYWIKGVLEASLHTKALIELGLEERSDAVKHPFRGVEEFPEGAVQAIPEGTNATTVFNQMGEGRTLLILGEPGSGKTVTLLKLAQDLIARVEEDLRQPIPVVFNLSSWARKKPSIEQWLVQELAEKYQVSQALGKSLVQTESLLLLLDGLDEVRAEHRNACVRALNQFMQAQGTTELVVCCRIKDYQALTEQLMLRSAICIQSLTLEQIDYYLNQVGAQLSTLRAVLHQDRELQALATSPLMLSIMSLTYQSCTLDEVAQGGTANESRQRLFNMYLDRMFQRRGTTQQYPRQQAQAWLIWLAQRMVAAAQTVFLIERLQLSWLPTQGQSISYRLGSSLSGGLLIGLMIGLIGVLDYMLTGAPNSKLIYDLIFGLIIGLAIALIAEWSGEIHPTERLKWSWRKAAPGFVGGFLMGELIILLAFGLRKGLLIGLVTGLYFGSNFGLIYGIEGLEIQQKEKPNQGIRQSGHNAAILTITSGLSCGLFMGFAGGLSHGLYFGLMGGLTAGLVGGGLACIRHFLLRLLLFRLGYSPWNYARFLDDCTDRLFLQKVGGGYIFVHRMLMEHFAAMPLEQGRR